MANAPVVVVPIPDMVGINVAVHVPLDRDVLVPKEDLEPHLIVKAAWAHYIKLPFAVRKPWLESVLPKLGKRPRDLLGMSVERNRAWTPQFFPINSNRSGKVVTSWEFNRLVLGVYSPAVNAFVPATEYLSEKHLYWWSPKDLQGTEVPEAFKGESAIWAIAKKAKDRVKYALSDRITPVGGVAKPWFTATEDSQFSVGWDTFPKEGEEIRVPRVALASGHEQAYGELEWLGRNGNAVLVVEDVKKIYPTINFNSEFFPQELKESDPYIWACGKELI